MHCLNCKLEIDDANESQLVCPGCGALPCGWREDIDVLGFLDEHLTISLSEDIETADVCTDIACPDEGLEVPSDLREAADDAEALLEAIGMAAFHLPDGLRLFRVPTERVM